MNNVAGAAVTFKKAAEPAFRAYAEQILRERAGRWPQALMDAGAQRWSPAAPTTT